MTLDGWPVLPLVAYLSLPFVVLVFADDLLCSGASGRR